MKNKKYTVSVTKTAWDMLVAHAQFLARVSPRAAERLVSDFVKLADNLSEMPERNPWLDHDEIPRHRFRKQLFGKRYLALYEVHEDAVFVDAVVDCRQDYIWILRRL